VTHIIATFSEPVSQNFWFLKVMFHILMMNLIMSGFNLKDGRLSVDMRTNFFPVRVVRPSPACPGALAVPKARLDWALSTLGWWKGSLPVAGGLGVR